MGKTVIEKSFKGRKRKRKEENFGKKHLYVNKFYYLITRGYHQNVGLHTYEI